MMSKPFAALVLVMGALASAPVFATLAPVVYTASTRGELSIDAEGRVVEVKLDHQQLGANVMESFEQQMMAWRFEPILAEGKPTPAYASVSLALFLVRDPGAQGVRIGFKEVTFVDATDEAGADAAARRMSPPRYPTRQAGSEVGARVKLFLQLDEEGRVVRSAAEEVFLLGSGMEDHLVDRHAEAFRKAAVDAAAGWVIPDAQGGRVVVPVVFTPPGTQGRWVLTRVAPVQAPAWVAEERAKDDIEELGGGGIRSSERWKLLTPTEG